MEMYYKDNIAVSIVFVVMTLFYGIFVHWISGLVFFIFMGGYILRRWMTYYAAREIEDEVVVYYDKNIELY